MERERESYNRTAGTSLGATRGGLKDEGSVGRASREGEKEDIDEEFDLAMEESDETDQMVPPGGNAEEDLMLSVS
jgi:hypothetical protein